MNEVADYAESIVNHVRGELESYQDYNASQPSFRELERRPAEAFIRLGYQDAITTWRPDLYAFFALQDCAQVTIISKLVPNRKLSDKVAALLSDGFSKIDFSLHERNLPLFFLDGYYRSLL